ncbi:MAG TPA: N-6 DNA methylase [Candidatus Lokiarchaeia archaeon]|nr:N-6 DNA methylase [Candidatus Lokiarchaeia archaeon]
MNLWKRLGEFAAQESRKMVEESQWQAMPLGLIIAIELALARYLSLENEDLGERFFQEVNHEKEKMEILSRVENFLQTSYNLNLTNLIPSPLLEFEEELDLNTKSLNALINFVESVPDAAFTGDFLGAIYQAWELPWRKATRGAYFTSDYLADTVIRGLKTADLQSSITSGNKPRVLDPACGSGTFLLRMLEKLAYLTDSGQNCPSCDLIGYDIDPIAVLISRLNLIIKWKMPEDRVIRSIILQDALQAPSTEQDIIVGNPPFFEVPLGQVSSIEPIPNPPSRVNIAALFVLKYAPMLNSEGQLAFIFPRAFLFSDRWLFLRQFLQSFGYAVPRLMLYGRGFTGVGLEQISLFLERKMEGTFPQATNIDEFERMNEDRRSKTWQISCDLTLQPPQYALPVFSTADVQPILETVWHNAVPLGDLCAKMPNSTDPAIFRGMGWEKYLIHKTAKKTADRHAAIKGTDILSFGIKHFRALDPSIWPSESREIPPKLAFLLQRPVVLCQRLVSSKTRVVAARLPQNVIPISTLTCVCLPPDSSGLAQFLTGVMNSSFASYYVADHVFLHSRLSTSLDKAYLRSIPIPDPNILSQTCLSSIAKQVGAIEALTTNLIRKQENLTDVTTKLAQNYHDLDSKIFNLYGLSEMESTLVAEKLRVFWEKN